MNIKLEIKYENNIKKVIITFNGKSFFDVNDKELIDLCLQYTGLTRIVSKYGISPLSLFSPEPLTICKGEYDMLNIDIEIDYRNDSLDNIHEKIKNRFEIVKEFVKEVNEKHSKNVGEILIKV